VDVRAPRMCSMEAIMKSGVENSKQIRRVGAEFFDRDPRRVSRDLLGKLLVRRQGRKRLIGRIVEVEAYLGTGDLAAHAAAGRTARNDVLFGPPGHAYVYFIYGNHYCLNISCLRDGMPGCILIRALEPVGDIEEMARARRVSAECGGFTQADQRSRAFGAGIWHHAGTGQWEKPHELGVGSLCRRGRFSSAARVDHETSGHHQSGGDATAVCHRGE